MIFERIVPRALIRPAVTGHLLPQAGEGILGAEKALSRSRERVASDASRVRGCPFRLNFIMR
jgi:hypothetical protein